MNQDTLLHIFSYLLPNIPFSSQYNSLQLVSKEWYTILREFPIIIPLVLELSLDKFLVEQEFIKKDNNITYIRFGGNNNVIIYKNIQSLIKHLPQVPNLIELISSSQRNTIKCSECIHHKLVLYDYDIEVYEELELLNVYLLNRPFRRIEQYLNSLQLNLCENCSDLTIPIELDDDVDYMLYDQAPEIIYNY